MKETDIDLLKGRLSEINRRWRKGMAFYKLAASMEEELLEDDLRILNRDWRDICLYKIPQNRMIYEETRENERKISESKIVLDQ